MTVTLAAFGTAPVPAQIAPSQIPPARSTPPELNATDLEVFLDGLMPSQLQREDIAGAVIAVVKNGKLIFAKGYGFSDVAKRTPVTPDATLFRPGSISKLFTWTSVMQLSEQGKLDLDKDVNEYLDFKIPAAWGKPITLKNIMTHTSGFEEVGRDLFVADAQHMHSLDRFLKDYVPARIFPPGVVPAYSNYATALAGYIVQRVSGKPLSQYVQDNILTPLQMVRTTLVQPLPNNLKPMMSSGYNKASDKAESFEFVEPYPAGSLSTTATDISRFMIAHLQNGEFEGKQILKPETAKLMHSRLFNTDDRLNGMNYGFYEESQNGKRIIGHGGDTMYFHSDLHLILEENVGFFVSYNSAGKGEISPRSLLFHEFLERYYPYTPPAAAKVQSAAEDAKSIEGFYKMSRRFDTSFASLLTVLGEAEVTLNTDGTISIDLAKGPDGQVKKFEEIAPLLYREVHGQEHLGFRKDASGRWEGREEFPAIVFQKVGFFENKTVNLAVLIFGLVVVSLTLLFWPVAAIVRKHYGRKLEYSRSDCRWRVLVRLVCLLFVIFALGWAEAISMANDITKLNRLSPWIIGLGILGHICLIGAIIACFSGFRSVRASKLSRWLKFHAVALALAAIGLTWFAMRWNLMNFRTHF